MTDIIWFAIKTRICIIALQTISNGLIPDHDPEVFVSPHEDSSNDVWLPEVNWIVETLLGGFARWDAQYFLHIATHGYTYEQTLAFYPLFPFIVGFLARLIYTVCPIMSAYYYSLVIAVLLNILFFVKAAECLLELSLRLTGNKKWAQLVAILFCLNPASIFFSAPYSEALYSWLTFKVMLETSDNSASFTRLVVPLSLSLICRSNGLINLGYVIYFALKTLLSQSKKVNKMAIVVRFVLVTTVALTLYGITQLYFYYLYCSHHNIEHKPEVIKYAINNKYILSGIRSNGSSPWCDKDLPLSYSYIQNHYWDVGFLNYYQWKQIPQFILATPILVILLHFCCNYIQQHTRYCVYLGLMDNKISKKITVFEKQIFPFMLHGLFLALFCIFFVHIQVSTRLLASSSPLLYWYCANYFKDTGINSLEDIRDIIFLDKSEARRLILCYFVGYAFIGTK
uniref:GPI mannosyltransferase 2 n=1 Tax=Culicoides sonorensis TaxID=179676 RepID=A0A336K805_CULSO